MEFCTACQPLDIRLSSFISHPGVDDNPRLKSPIYELGRLQSVRKKSKTCHLCRLLFAALQHGPFSKVTNRTDFGKAVLFGTWINALGPSKEQRLRSPALYLLFWVESPLLPSDTYKIVVRAASRMLPDQPYFGRISPVRESYLDFKFIGQCLVHCERNHSTCKDIPRAAKPTKHFFVIDTRSKCITRASENCRYLALSYVWGDASQLQLTESNFEKLTKPNSLQDKDLTATIRDAMALTGRIGERFLWVDALCIVQDSDLIRQQTIQDMDRIYADSLLTIVAGTCISADDRLSGVSTKRTWTQWYQNVSPSLSLVASFDFKDHLESSKYNERAWTFQEFQLATRTLIFSPNGQVYYSCKEAAYSEEVIASKSLEPDAVMLEGANLVKMHADKDRLWSVYQRAVKAITSRMLSNEWDILNAFTGVLKMICSDRSLEGLPTSVFDLALLWQPSERMRRRERFCSWSWAGWVGKVHWFDYGFIEGKENGEIEMEKITSWTKEKVWIVWYSTWGTNTKSAAYMMDGPPWLRGSSPTAEAHQERFPGQPRNFLPTRSLLTRRLSNLGLQRRRIRYLQFWTISAYFQIDLDTSAVLRYSSVLPENTGNGLRYFILRNSLGEECGWVLLDESWIKKTSAYGDTVFEFILLSEGAKTTADNDTQSKAALRSQVTVDESSDYNAMMIIWRDGIAERAGLGRVLRYGLQNPYRRPMRWKEIVLG